MDAVHSELERLGKSRKSGAVNYLLNKTSVEYGGWSFTSINTFSSRQIKDLLYFRLHRFYAAFFIMGATHISKEYGGRHANLALLSLADDCLFFVNSAQALH